MSKKPIRNCIDCNRLMKITGRGRCGKCYKITMKNNLPNDYISPFNTNISSFNTGNIPTNKGKTIPDHQKQYLSKINQGENHPKYKHGKWITWNKRARRAMEEYLERKLKTNEIVHHIDGNIKNNEASNLMLFQNHSEHMKYHWKIQKEKKIKGRFKKI